ncbi:XdhC family protein [Fusobacterium sp. PH5-44]|uniref:XdhC family protein n=1 Tax=unclassified Fusobacterium TaxID=2648384 RepID=UPI003D234A99
MGNRTFFEMLAKYGQGKRAIILDGIFKGIEIVLKNSQSRENLSKKISIDNLKYLYNIINNQNKSEVISSKIGNIFVEVANVSPRLIILGGGHISLPLSVIGKMCDFEVVIVDDRMEFSNNVRFPAADKVICCDFEKLYNYIETKKNDYFVIVTRGHLNDEACLETIINKKSYIYLGMIGSKTKVELTIKNMEKKGYSKEKLSKIHAPIGLKIGGQSPGEIAISIGAQLVQEKNKICNELIDSKLIAELLDNKEKRVLCTVIEKNGSGPRGVGSKMLVKFNGEIIGTIGGGSLEYEAIKKSTFMMKNMISEKFFYEEFNLSNIESSALGMICGGKIKVLFEII